MEHQFHYSRKFYKDKKTGYWISSSSPKIRAHVWVWRWVHRDIPKGMQIHHIDGDKSNNEIENLEMLTPKQHAAKHLSEKRRQTSICHINRIRHLTKEWHASDEGIEWHRQHGIKTWEERKKIQIQCKHCSCRLETKTYHQDFCSGACKSAWRRKEGLDNEERRCETCQKVFTVNKYAKKKTCGRKCGALFRSKIH